MNTQHFENFKAARDHFYATAAAVEERTGLSVSTKAYVHPERKDPDGQPLQIDTVRIGPEDAQNMLMSQSGTHGPEIIPGSRIQSGSMYMLGRRMTLPPDTALTHVHGLSAYGSAYCTRWEENGADSNRIFGFHPTSIPQERFNPLRIMQESIQPAKFGWEIQKFKERFVEHLEAGTLENFLWPNVMAGQNEFADGLFYTGKGPTWTARTFQTILDDHLDGVEHCAVIDFHTGLGDFGACEDIYSGKDSDAEYKRACSFYGQVTAEHSGQAVSQPMSGDSFCAFNFNAKVQKLQTLTRITHEIGTYPLAEVFSAVVAAKWAEQPEARPAFIRQAQDSVREAFAPASGLWTDRILINGVERIKAGLKGLEQTPLQTRMQQGRSSGGAAPLPAAQ